MMLDLLDLSTEARLLADEIRRSGVRIVLAESCTAGLASAALAAIPGISKFFCGSAVTYRDSTKQEWLGISAADIAEFTAVSKPVTRQMALGVLGRTSEADWSAAVTGHLGPDAPEYLDGLVYVAVAHQELGGINTVSAVQQELTARDRISRQQEAAALLLAVLRFEIIRGPDGQTSSQK